MRDYKDAIQRAFAGLGKQFDWIDDPNDHIDAILGQRIVNWYPTYMIVCEGRCYMFRPFSYSNYLDDNEITSDIAESQKLVSALAEAGQSPRVLFITNAAEDVYALSRLVTSDDYGILHNEAESPAISFTVQEATSREYRLIPSVLEYLSTATNLRGEIGERIRQFAKDYLSVQDGPQETELIRRYVGLLLRCDKRFALDSDSIELMATLELFFADSEESIRDHYFHAVNTMLLGFMALDSAYELFSTLAKNLGDDIVPEFIWLLASLYHDIGYVIERELLLEEQMSGLSRELDPTVLVNECRQKRLNRWEKPQYNLIVGAANHLFYHLLDNTPDKWAYDAFPRPDKDTQFVRSLRAAFVDDGAHGAAGAIKLALLLREPIKAIQRPQDREFLYRHVLLASISILFHDGKVRKRFRDNSIDRVKAEKFAFSALLSYVDVLQADRRDITGAFSRPDIFRDIRMVNGKILAILDREALSESLKRQLRKELEDVLSFFEMDGIAFEIPVELMSN